MEYPQVDIVIATIGRQSLSQAILAAVSQTYREARTVVIGDGPCPDAQEQFNWLRGRFPARLAYYETPEWLGYGDGVKRWWIDHKDAGEWLRFLDDDDWIPPYAIADMMQTYEPGTTVILCGMIMSLASRHHAAGTGRHDLRLPKMEPHHASSGMSIINTAAARKSGFPGEKLTDFGLCKDVAAQGTVKLVEHPLYWYSGHLGGKPPVTERALGSPYPRAWPFRPPRTFRKSLLCRVHYDNFFDADGKHLATYDQALFRPMDRLARRRAVINRQVYYYDIPDPESKCVSLYKIKEAAAFIEKRGYVSTGRLLAPGPDDTTRPLICFLVTLYKKADKVGRCIESIKKQAGDWECIIGVDGNDTKSAMAAGAAIGDDKRFRVIVHKEHLYALGNVLALCKLVASHQVVALVDADDYLMVNDVSTELQGFYADPDIEMVCGAIGKSMKVSSKELSSARGRNNVMKPPPLATVAQAEIISMRDKMAKYRKKFVYLQDRLANCADAKEQGHIIGSARRVLTSVIDSLSK